MYLLALYDLYCVDVLKKTNCSLHMWLYVLHCMVFAVLFLCKTYQNKANGEKYQVFTSTLWLSSWSPGKGTTHRNMVEFPTLPELITASGSLSKQQGSSWEEKSQLYNPWFLRNVATCHVSIQLGCLWRKTLPLVLGRWWHWLVAAVVGCCFYSMLLTDSACLQFSFFPWRKEKMNSVMGC